MHVCCVQDLASRWACINTLQVKGATRSANLVKSKMLYVNAVRTKGLCTWVVVSCCCMAARSPEECILLWRPPASEAPGIETGSDICRLLELAVSSAALCRRKPPAEGLGNLDSTEGLLLAACCVRAYTSCTGCACSGQMPTGYQNWQHFSLCSAGASLLL